MNYGYLHESFKIVIEEIKDEYYVRISTNGKPDKKLCEKFKDEILKDLKDIENSTINRFAITNDNEILYGIAGKLSGIYIK
jgi:hypothetical protein